LRQSADPLIDQEKGLQGKLSTWQLGMIAIGGAIGVGLFLGSQANIGLAGPGVVLTCLFGGAVALVIGLALAKMASVYPAAGSFGIYAERYVSPWAGFIVRLTYWFGQSLAIGAQVTAVGVYSTFWFPEVPAWVFILVASVLVIAINRTQVHLFGSLESYLSLIKVFAIVAFTILGFVLILGIGRPEGSALGFATCLHTAASFLTAGLAFGWHSLWWSPTSWVWKRWRSPREKRSVPG
jgi:L-asparagine transporter-like permease